MIRLIDLQLSVVFPIERVAKLPCYHIGCLKIRGIGFQPVSEGGHPACRSVVLAHQSRLADLHFSVSLSGNQRADEIGRLMGNQQECLIPFRPNCDTEITVTLKLGGSTGDR
jgi:hypothetical protein